MTATRRRAGFGLGLAALAAAVSLAAPQPRPKDPQTGPARARAFFRRGLDHWARGDEQAMLAAMWSSWQADPGYLPPLLEVAAFYSETVPGQVRAALDSMAGDSAPGVGYCARLIGAFMKGRKAPLPPAGAAAGPCHWYATVKDVHRAGGGSRQLQAARALFGRYPESPAAAGELFKELTRHQWADSVVFWARRLTEEPNHALVRAVAHVSLAPSLHVLGRHAEARSAERRAAELAAVSPPRVRFYILGMYEDWAHGGAPAGSPSPLKPHADSLLQVAAVGLREVLSAADAVLSLGLRLGRARADLDNGNLAASLAQWDSLAALADERQDPTLKSFVYMYRGRTRVKLGHWGAAERDLLSAREWAAYQPDLRKAYEVEHNLLHLYEAMGRDDDARLAGEAFVRRTLEAGLHGVRMMSHRDLGWFLHRRGQPELARTHFEAMIADVDSLGDDGHNYEFFAGEYYELIGDFDRALVRYRRAAAQADPSRSIEALARVAEATGDLGSALTHVRRHDAIVVTNNPEYRPLLPGLLARSGRLADAEAELRRARAAAADRGQVAGWARLSLDLAGLLHRTGRLGQAIAEADSTVRAAGRVADVETQVRALALGALARVHQGGANGAVGLAGLRRAASRSARLALPQLEVDVLVMLGDAFTETGALGEALMTYRRAGTISDSIALSLGQDPVRAGFRGAAQRRISDRALDAIVARGAGNARASGWYAQWSMWRKGREITRQHASRGAPGSRGHSELARIGALLGDQHAVIDYVVLDSAVAALVLTDQGARIVQLPVRAGTLQSRVESLYRGISPRVGSFVDRSRSAFDRPLARQLHRDLVEPLAGILGDRRSITIIADGPLHLLPFDALVASDSPTIFALDRYTISLAPSLAGLEAGVGLRLPAGPLVAFGGPAAGDLAAGMERELVMLRSETTGRHVETYVGPDAGEATVRSRAPPAAILHFAAHGRPSEHQPDYGAIMLAPSGDDDGRLHVHEIRNLGLHHSLVVLSACESAVGRLVVGAGALSLSRAFLQGGASGVVGTLWPVGPATTDLMTVFYRELAGGRQPAEALRRAKLALRHGADPDPFTWAAFTLVTLDR